MAKRAEKDWTKTSRILTSSSKRQAGFTLLELLVVVALMATMAVFVVPSVSNYFKLNLNTSARELASVIKEGYQSTVVTRQINRVVYNFKDQQYWVESGPIGLLLDTPPDQNKEMKRTLVRSKRFGDKDKDDTGAAFGLNVLVTRKKLSLPNGVEFEDIITARSSEPITSGQAYTHFFPHGTAERTTIHLKDSQNHHITLVILPLVGRTKLIEGYATKEETDVQ